MKRLPLVVLLALPALVSAQETPVSLGPRSFFPREYTKEFFVDVDQLQDTAIWDAFERTPFSGTLRTQFRTGFGFRIDDVKSVRAALRWIDEKENSPAGEREVSVTVLQGKTVRLPLIRKKAGYSYLELKKEEIRGLEVVSEAPREDYGGWPEARLYVVPQPGCLVIGSEEMIRSVLEGKRRGGVIDSRLMALTALRKPLAYAAIGFPPENDPRYAREIGMDANWLTDTDPLRHLIARVEYDEKTEDVTVKVTFRFQSGKKGPQLLEDGIKGSIEGLKAQNVYSLVKTYFDKLTWRRDREDLHVSIVLKPSHMSGLFGASGVLTFFFMSGAAPVLRAPIAPAAAVPAKAAEPAAKRDAKRDAKNEARKAAPKATPAPKAKSKKRASRPEKD